MTALKGYLITAAVALLVGAGGGLGFAWEHWKPKTVVETAAPALRQKDSSLVLERAPDPQAKPAAIVPKGQTVARIERVEVQGPTQIVHDTIEVPATTGPTAAREIVKIDTVKCDPVTVELTLTELADGTHRVIASSPTGRILNSSVDIPVKDAVVPRVLRWSAGPIWGGGDNGVGINVTRDLGPTRLVGAVMRAPARGALPVHTVAMLGANIKF